MAMQEGFNQSPPYVDVDLFASDQPLREVITANGAEDEAMLLAAFGRRWGAADMAEQARLANENPPKLHAYDAKGFRRDVVEYHPSYHHFLKESIGANLHASTWTTEGEREDAPAEVVRAARCYMVAQVENGHLNPVTMTRAAVAALACQADVTADMIKKVVTRHYDPSFRPWEEKFGITLGIAMTERQGGTDVRTNVTRAEATSDGYELTGHKWFASAPMSDAFLVLAQANDAPTAFLVPRFRPDGTINGLEFQRLKDKLGNRSNASTEMQFDKAFAWRIGGEGDGIATIMASVQLTRVDCAVGSAGFRSLLLRHVALPSGWRGNGSGRRSASRRYRLKRSIRRLPSRSNSIRLRRGKSSRWKLPQNWMSAGRIRSFTSFTVGASIAANASPSSRIPTCLRR